MTCTCRWVPCETAPTVLEPIVSDSCREHGHNDQSDYRTTVRAGGAS